MATILTDTEVNNLCTTILSNARFVDVRTLNLYTILYHTGSRVSDVLQNPQFQFDKITGLLTYTQIKNQRMRSLNILPQMGLTATEANSYIESARMLSYSQHTENFARCYNGAFIFCKNKHITTHIFRHNYAKNLKNQGLNSTQIAQNLGVRNAAQAEQYSISIIYA